MRLLYAKEICFWGIDELIPLMRSREEFRLLFDDVEITTNWQETIVSWFFWEPIRDYPETPILAKYHLQGNDISLEDKLQNRVHNGVLMAYPNEDRENVEAATYRGKNLLHNFFTTEGEPYNTTMDATVLHEIWSHPEMQKSVAESEATKSGVNNLYTQSIKLIKNSPDLKRNQLALAVRSNLPKNSQLNQVITYRGLCSEVDQRIFPNMVAAGFAEGIHRPVFVAMVSRDASKALQATDDPVKQTEYYNRELQLFTYILNKIKVGDCGSTETIPWEVKASEMDHILPGTFYKTKDGSFKPIRVSDRFLIGQTIQIRSPACCWEEQDGVICSTCAGKVTERFQKGTNAGHAATVTQNQRVSQDVISTKHVLVSAVSQGFDVDPFYQDYLQNSSEESELILAAGIWDKKIDLVIKINYLPRLADIHTMEEFSIQDLQRISSLQDISMRIYEDTPNEDGELEYKTIVIPISHGSYRPFLTNELIWHMKDYGFENDGREVIIDLSQWNPSEPIVRFPARHSSTLEMMMELKKTIFMSTDQSKAWLNYDLTDPDILSMAIGEISDMTNQKFSVNLTIIQLILYCMMSRDPKNNDYRLPKKGTGRFFDTKFKIADNRSLGQKAAYERQYVMVGSPDSYLYKMRPNVPLDWMLLDVDAESRRTRIEFKY